MHWFSELGSGDKIALISAVVALLQFIALVATWGVMRQSARRQLRAYVSGLPDFISSFDETHYPTANYTLRNLGQTPAVNLVHRAQIAAFPFPLPVGFRLPPLTSRPAPTTVLFPNLPANGGCSMPTPFTDAELTAIRNRSMRVYIFGEMRYRDVFRKRRRSSFCVSLYVPDDAVLAKLTSNSTERFEGFRYEAAPVGNTSR
jgi:hypothetical protein